MCASSDVPVISVRVLDYYGPNTRDRDIRACEVVTEQGVRVQEIDLRGEGALARAARVHLWGLRPA